MRSDTAARRLLFATHAMATRFEIVIEDTAPQHAQSVAEAVIAEIERLHRTLSRFEAESLLSHINRTAARAPVRLDADTFALMSDARDIWLQSGGAFDPARGSGMSGVVLSAGPRTIAFENPAIQLDLGAIAKGHAVQRAVDIMRDAGIDRAFVHGGTSSVAAIGTPLDDDRGWGVSLAPHNRHHVFLRDSALSASSSALREHITDPRTNAAAAPLRIACVVGPCARAADAWSTALVVLRERPTTMDACWTTFFDMTDNHE